MFGLAKALQWNLHLKLIHECRCINPLATGANEIGAAGNLSFSQRNLHPGRIIDVSIAPPDASSTSLAISSVDCTLLGVVPPSDASEFDWARTSDVANATIPQAMVQINL
jgi:hypothetical protein